MAKREKYKFLENKAGILGWYGSSKYNLERYLYLLQRVTGIGLIIFVFLHIAVTSTRVSYKLWIEYSTFFHSSISHVGMFIVILALLFHGLNGIRLIINEYGFLLGKPERPVYPYRKVLKTNKPKALLLIMLIIGIILLIGAAYEFAIAW